MGAGTRTVWPYGHDADEDDPLTAMRIPVTSFKPGFLFLASFDRESAERPTDAEARMLRSYIDYRRSQYREWYQAKLLERPLDTDDSIVTITFHKYGADDWAFRRWTWEFGPLFVPSYDREKPLGLAAVLDRVHTIVDTVYEPWTVWKTAHPEVFGGGR